MKNLLSSLMVFILKGLSYLPLWILYVISDFLFLLVYRLFKYRRQVVRDNLLKSFPEKSNQELKAIEHDFFKFLCDLILETVKGYSMSRAETRKRVVFKETEIYDELFEKGKNGIVVLGHQGNWEWVSRAAPLWVRNKLAVVYKPLSDKKFEVFMNKARSEFGAELIPMSDVARFILREKQPFLLILLADQTPTDSKTSIWTKFLNQETAILPGPAKLSQKYNIPLIYHSINRKSRGYYECVPKVLIQESSLADEKSLTELHVRQLESEIRRDPATWLWSHRRWKLKK